MDNIQTEIIQNVMVIRLDRPEKFNSFIRPMALRFQQELAHAAENDTIRSVMITGLGKAFCAGQDLAEAIQIDGPGLSRIVSEHYNPIIHAIVNHPKPVVAAVNGVAAGAGANIALACDIVIASEQASFIQAFSKIGLIPDSGGTFFLPKLVGRQKALGMMMFGDKIDAHTADRLGMVYKVLPAEGFELAALEYAHALANLPTRALHWTKMAVNAAYHQDLESQLALEDKLQTEAGHTHDYHEGVQAFLEKRKPNFKGL